MQITLTIPDTKADSFLDVLRHISYVEIQPSDPSPPSASNEEEFYEGLKEAVNEVNDILAGRKQGRPIKELLAELRSSDGG